jgi:ribosome modulation factor
MVAIELLDEPIDRIYREGMTAFSDGIDQKDCPYHKIESRPKFLAWRGGWAEARLMVLSPLASDQ